MGGVESDEEALAHTDNDNEQMASQFEAYPFPAACAKTLMKYDNEDDFCIRHDVKRLVCYVRTTVLIVSLVGRPWMGMGRARDNVITWRDQAMALPPNRSHPPIPPTNSCLMQ